MIEICIDELSFNKRKEQPIVVRFSKHSVKLYELVKIKSQDEMSYGKIIQIKEEETEEILTIIDLEATFDLKEEMHKSEYVYRGHLIVARKDTISLPNGKGAYREVLEHPGAAAILVINENQEVYLERQYRYPVNDVILEIPAGKLNPHENPLLAATRELEEETGLIAKKITKLGELYPAIGYSNEIIHIYYANEFEQGKNHLDIDEFVDVVLVPLSLVIEWIQIGKIKDSKTIAAIFYYLEANSH